MRRVIVGLAFIAVAATWTYWLRPTALGGDASYVIVDGSSMEPTYEDGDLVVVRRQATYQDGDVIAFHAGAEFGYQTRVIHRIVGTTADGGFTTQGDNRDEVDPWEPSSSDIIGRAMLHVPMAGDAAGILTRPQTFAALGGTAVIVGGTKRRRRRRRTAPTPSPKQATVMSRVQRVINDPDPRPARLKTSSGSRFTQPRWAFIGLLASVALAVPVLAVAWSALRAPDSTQRTETTGAIDYGIGLDYRFSGTPSAVYPEGAVEASRNAAGAVVSGGPLYSRLLDRLDATVAFRATESGAQRLESTYRVDVTVETPGGWTATLDTIDGGTFERTASEILTVDLRAVADQVASVAALTGVGGDSYTIVVTPRLDVLGGNDSTEVNEQISAPMSFAVEGNLITADALEIADTESLSRTVNERAMYAAGPLEMRTQPARAVLSGLALVLVAGIAWFASVLFGGVGLIEPDRIAARYRSQIVDVAVATAPPGPVVMVGGIDELSRIAKVEQTVILHEDLGDGAHRYRVFLGSVTYEYEAAPEHAGAASETAAGADVEEPGG